MAHANTILLSLSEPGGSLCVDVFLRPDGSFGFEEFRRDVEDSRGWFAIGHYDHRRFATQAAAFEEACQLVGWLNDANGHVD